MTLLRLRCLVVREPYASLIAQGRKTVEVRSWRPRDGWFEWDPCKGKDRCPFGFNNSTLFCATECHVDDRVLIVVARKPRSPLSGKAICTVIPGGRPWLLAKEDREATCIPKVEFAKLLGDSRQTAWPLSRVVRLFDPIPLKGRLGLWVEQVEEDRLRGANADAWRYWVELPLSKVGGTTP